MDLDWPMDAFLRPNHPERSQSIGSTTPEGPFQFTAGRGRRNGSINKDDVEMITEPLYADLDEQGNSVIHPGFSSWLSALPDPISPIERYQRELKSYPTGIVRLAKRRRDEFEGGNGGKSAHAFYVGDRPGTPADGAVHQTDRAKTPGEHLKYIGPLNSAHDKRERPPVVHYSLPREADAQRRVAWHKVSLANLSLNLWGKKPSPFFTHSTPPPSSYGSGFHFPLLFSLLFRGNCTSLVHQYAHGGGVTSITMVRGDISCEEGAITIGLVFIAISNLVLIATGIEFLPLIGLSLLPKRKTMRPGNVLGCRCPAIHVHSATSSTARHNFGFCET